MELIDAKIWISKNASLCRVFANRVTYGVADSIKWFFRTTVMSIGIFGH